MNAARTVFLALLLCWGTTALAEVTVPPLSGRVVDQTGTMSSGDLDSLQRTLRAFESRKGSQIAVLIVPTTVPETIEQYSLRVAEAWKIGRKKIDDGALLVVAKDDRRLRIEVGYGLEGALNDVTAKRIIDEVITPKFKSGDFAGGISTGVDRIIRVIDGEKLPAPTVESQWRPGPDQFGAIDLLNPWILFGLFIAGMILRSMLGRLIGSVTTGGVVGVVAWFFAGSLALSIILAIIVFIFTLFGEVIESLAGSRSGSGSGRSYSGGSSSGSWSGGGSSGSSSSSSDSGGGGGSFGGGGASGSW